MSHHRPFSFFRRVSVCLAACLSLWLPASTGQDAGKDAPEWWTEELGERSEVLWKKLWADGKVTAGEVLQELYLSELRGEADVEGAAARLLLGYPEDPIPALRDMLRHNESSRRVYAATIMGNLGDVRLEPELSGLVADKTELVEDLASWYGERTVGGVAASAMELIQRGGDKRAHEDRQLPSRPWLVLRPAAVPEMDAALEEARKRSFLAREKEQADYRKNLAEIISSSREVEIFLLSFEMQKEDAGYYNWQRDLQPDRFPIIPYGQSSQILQRKRLSPDEIKALMPSLKATVSVKENFGGAFCHFPIHGLRIRSGEEIIFQTSICYECGNFYIEYDSGGQEGGWTGLSSNEFQELMTQLMPIPAAEIERFERFKQEMKGEGKAGDGK